jgi:fungal type III polyketide synthase
MAALKALEVSPTFITHMVSVTATNSGSPGYDQLVARELGIPETAERILLSGIGCAGGLAALRTASQIVMAATYRHLEARVLVVACEISSIQVRSEFHSAAKSKTAGIGPVLFGDGASALVLCNSRALNEKIPKRFLLVDCCTKIIPNTDQEMSYRVTSHGFHLSLSKEVPALVASAVKIPFQHILRAHDMVSIPPDDFDWALHPGGSAIIRGVQIAMGLSDRTLIATNEIYKSRGNVSSVAVLAVLDKLRTMDKGKENVIACSFGPGLTVEMALLKRFL